MPGYASHLLDKPTLDDIIHKLKGGQSFPIFQNNSEEKEDHDQKRRIVPLSPSFWRSGKGTNKIAVSKLFSQVAKALSEAFSQTIKPGSPPVGIITLKNSTQQVPHFDLDLPALRRSVKLAGDRQYSFSMLIALDQRYQLDVWPKCFGDAKNPRTTSVRIALGAGSILVFRQDFIHAGTNIHDTYRLFSYLDNDRIDREPDTRGVVPLSEHRTTLPRQINPVAISAQTLLERLDAH